MKYRPIVLRVRMDFEYVEQVPEDWDANMINFHRNEGSWCASNIFQDIMAASNNDPPCVCENTVIDYLREATADDLDKWPGNWTKKDTP